MARRRQAASPAWSAMRGSYAPGTMRGSSSIRAITVAVLVAVGVFLGLGHGLHNAMPDVDGHGAADLASVCLVVFTVAAPLLAALAWLRLRHGHAVLTEARGAVVRRLTAPVRAAGRARASPAVLQRFLN